MTRCNVFWSQGAWRTGCPKRGRVWDPRAPMWCSPTISEHGGQSCVVVTRSIDSPKQGEWWNRSKDHQGVQLGAKGDGARDTTRQKTHYPQHRFMVHAGNRAGDRHTYHATQGKQCTGWGPEWSFSGHWCPQGWRLAGFCNLCMQGKAVHIWRSRQMMCQRCGIKGGLYSHILLSPQEYTQNYRSRKASSPMGIYTKLQIFESSFPTNYVNIFLSNSGGGKYFFPHFSCAGVLSCNCSFKPYRPLYTSAISTQLYLKRAEAALCLQQSPTQVF